MKGGTRGVKFLRRISLTTLVRLTQNDQIRQDNTGGEHISRGQPRPYHKGAGSKRSQLWGSFLFMCTPFVAELPNLTR